MNQKRVWTLSLAVLSVLVLVRTAWVQQPATQPGVIDNAVVNEPVASDISPPLSQLVERTVTPSGSAVIPVLRPKLAQLKAAGAPGGSAPPLGLPSLLIGATVGLNVEGIGQNSSSSGYNCPPVSGVTLAPPDPNLAVGDTQVVQWVNVCYAVFDKSTGAKIAGPFPGNAFWKGFKSSCISLNQGDPIIQWDKANHVWVAAQNTFSPYLTCVAISTTPDATGTYNRYAFTQPGFPDYPKWGLTPTVYYQTQNDFGPSGSAFAGVNVCAYDGVAMRAGKKTAAQICILDNSNGTLFDDSMLPADWDSAAGSNADTTEVLLGSIDNANPGSHVYEYVFNVSFKGKPSATLTGVNGSLAISVPTYSLGCGGAACIKQPGVADLLDSLGDRLMYRLARSDDSSGTQHFLVTHSVNDTAAVAARWYEFRAPSSSTSLTLYQSGQTPDDTEYRWMGSIARDKLGNIALGYSRSSGASGDYPSIYLSGQTAGDPLGTTDTESLVFSGTGSQTDTNSRWGDYTAMALDGADSCTFWYTNQYYPATRPFAWNTRIAGKIKFPGCP